MANSVLGLAIFSAVLGMFQFGYNTGVINAPQSSIEKFINESFLERYESVLTDAGVTTLFSVAVSIYLGGGMIGGLSGGWLANKLGPKRGLIYVQVVSLLGALAMGTCKPASSYELLLIGRFLSGLACGAFTNLVPLYITEIAPVKLRGGLGAANQLAVTIGIFTSMILGLNEVLGSEDLWPVLLAIIAIPALIQIMLLPFMPESPKYTIITCQDAAKGKKALKQLRSTPEEVESEVQAIQHEAESSSASGMSVWKLLTNPQLYLQLFVVICMHLSQQLSGMVAIFYYSTNFFIGGGIEQSEAQYATIGVGAIMVVMTLITIPLMDKAGRRTLHLIGIVGMVICTILITIALSQRDENQQQSGIGIFLIASTLIFVVFFAVGPGSIPWLITGEVFAHSSRSAAISIATFVNWSGNLAVGLIFPVMQTELTNFSFLPFTIILAVLFVILYFYLPETKGLAVSEIVQQFQVEKAWKTPIGIRKRNPLLTSEEDSSLSYGTTQTK